MENWNQNQSNNWQSPNYQNTQKNIPNSIGGFVLGIISLILMVVCCCYGPFFSIITSIIGLVLSTSAKKSFQTNPTMYLSKSFNKAKAGYIMNLIAFILSAIGIITLIILVVFQKELGLEEYNNQPWNFDDWD